MAVTEATAIRVKQWHNDHPEEIKQYAATRRARNKERVFDMYGRACRCCGENLLPLLTLEHKAGNPKQRHQNLEWVRAFKENNSDNWEILCWNCNSGQLANGGVCPHETETVNILQGVT